MKCASADWRETGETGGGLCFVVKDVWVVVGGSTYHLKETDGRGRKHPYMSHYQNKGDRSEAQLRKAGRGSVGHSRAGGGQSLSVKGGGPSPFNSAPSGGGPPQPSSSAVSAVRPTAVAASTNRG